MTYEAVVTAVPEGWSAPKSLIAEEGERQASSFIPVIQQGFGQAVFPAYGQRVTQENEVTRTDGAQYLNVHAAIRWTDILNTSCTDMHLNCIFIEHLERDSVSESNLFM